MFGMGFTEIMIIAVIGILFLGPDKLPSAMVEIAKFFKNVKNTVGTVKESIEQEINVADLKKEALAYKKELLVSQQELKDATDIGVVKTSLSDLGDSLMNVDDILGDELEVEDKPEPPKQEKVEFKKSKKKIQKEESKDV